MVADLCHIRNNRVFGVKRRKSPFVVFTTEPKMRRQINTSQVSYFLLLFSCLHVFALAERNVDNTRNGDYVMLSTFRILAQPEEKNKAYSFSCGGTRKHFIVCRIFDLSSFRPASWHTSYTLIHKI